MRNGFQITADNIQTVNNRLKKQFRINRCCDAANITARVLGPILFLALCCLMTYGMICIMDEDCLNFPVLGEIWERFCSYLPIMEWKWYISVPVMLLTLYLPMLLLHLLIYIVILLLYRPKNDFKELAGNPCEQARILVENHKKALSRVSCDYEMLTIVFCTVSAVLLSLGSLTVLCLSNEDWLETLLSMILPVAVLGIVLWIVSAPYWIWIFQFGYSGAKNKYGKAIDSYLLENDPEEKARREEAEKRKAERSHQKHEDNMQSIAQWYAQQKKESEEYKRRLHEWATGDDDPTPGSGDGI